MACSNLLFFVLKIGLYVFVLLISSSFCVLDTNPLLDLCIEMIFFLYVIFSSTLFSVLFAEYKVFVNLHSANLSVFPSYELNFLCLFERNVFLH